MINQETFDNVVNKLPDHIADAMICNLVIALLKRQRQEIEQLNTQLNSVQTIVKNFKL